MKQLKPYYVINWDFNKDTLEHYDIIPYLAECYYADKKSRSKNAIHPKTFDEFKEFILNKSSYMYWSRCQYEVLVSDWPKKANIYKLDIYEQIEMNIDIITTHFIGCVL